MYAAYHYQHVASRCINCQDFCVPQSAKISAFHSLMQQNACHRNTVNLCRFLAMLLLRNKDQQQNNPLATFATHLCKQMRGHE